jgi:hypothetical protein
MGSGAMIYIPSFINIVQPFKELMGGGGIHRLKETALQLHKFKFILAEVLHVTEWRM